MSTSYSKPIAYDLDMHNDERGYYHYFVRSYMDMVHDGLQELAYDFKGKTVYDIGVGRGRAFPIYQSLGITRVIGFDVDEYWVSFARQKAKKFGIDLTIQMNDDNVAVKSVAPNSCDVVSLMYTLSFYPTIRNELIEEAKRIVRPGGLIIVMDVPKPSMMSILNTVVRMPRIFSTVADWQAYFQPLTIIAIRGSNHWYFFNAAMDILGKFFGPGVYKLFDTAAKKMGIPASTNLMVFQK